MSRPTPAAFWSAMSMMTMSASSLSASARATVAPTAPAPPTTVTFLFIRLPALHVADDGVRERGCLQLGRALHLPGEIVRDLLVPDCLFEPTLDGVGRATPAEIAEHHDAGEDDRAGIDDVLARILRCGAVRGFEEADVVADVRARRDSEPANLGCAGVGQVVAIEVGAREHVVVGRSRQDLLEDAIGDAIVDEDLALPRRATPHFLLGHDVVAELGGRHFVSPVPERALGELHDVPLVDEGEGLALVVHRVL